MGSDRAFTVADFLKPADGEPVRSVITQSADAAVVAWTVKPGQTLSAHVHPEGQDTWTILSGTGRYRVDEAGSVLPVSAGHVLVAHRGEVHGVVNNGDEPLVFVSVVSPSASGYVPL